MGVLASKGVFLGVNTEDAFLTNFWSGEGGTIFLGSVFFTVLATTGTVTSLSGVLCLGVSGLVGDCLIGDGRGETDFGWVGTCSGSGSGWSGSASLSASEACCSL